MQLSALVTLAMITAATANTTYYRRTNKPAHAVAVLNTADWYVTDVGGVQHCASHSGQLYVILL